jgi:methionyl-tRNA formyltransferase
MIWIFCNLGYGLPFLEEAGRVAREEGLAVTAVMSTRDMASGARSSRILDALAEALRRRRFRKRFGIEMAEVPDVNGPDFARRLGSSDSGVIAGFNQIFSTATIGRFASLVNFHPSILPFYRGPVPSHWCIENGEESTGFTVHRVTGRIDSGEPLFQQTVPIGPLRDPAALDRSIAETAAPVMRAWLRHLKTGEPWKTVTVDARRVYRHPVDYASFPAGGARERPARVDSARKGPL